MVRRATGGTLACARAALRDRGPALNLLGGFHHAGPDRAWGMCPMNDLAITVASLRAEGFTGHVLILDLDAHPPDGTAACLGADRHVTIASISGSDWGAVGGAREILLPPGTGDDGYLTALTGLLGELRRPDLALVVAGGDVRGGDPLGRLALTEDGVARRDAAVAAWLGEVPSVWTPGGGYRDDAWRVLARTALALLHPDLDPPTADVDPLPAHFATIAASLGAAELGFGADLDDDDVAMMFGERRVSPRLLGAYTRQGVELGLERYAILPAIRRLGYAELRVDLDRATQGDRLRLYGTAGGAEHLLVEAVLALEEHAGKKWLFVHWLTLRHPRAPLPPGRRLLPGQDAPGLGLGPEAAGLLGRMAVRLGAAGLMFRPAWLHVAWQARDHFRFLDGTVQAHFEALLRDLGHLGLPALSAAVSAGRVRLHGQPWPWPAEVMVELAAAPAVDAAAREAARFSVVEG